MLTGSERACDPGSANEILSGENDLDQGPGFLSVMCQQGILPALGFPRLQDTWHGEVT
jgi:hypothetical protein